jgi:hypothetical protein
MKEETTEERDERFKKEEKELKSSKDYQDFMSIRIFLLEEVFSDFMLFRINNNLKRIADSLDAIFLKL